jgi:anti-anti-sigma factor
MQLELISDDGEILRLRCKGPIRQEEIGENPLEPFLAFGGYARRVVLDLGGAEAIDSSGFGWLVKNHSRFQHAGGMLVSHTLSPRVAQAVNFLHMGHVLNLAPDEATALDMARGGQPAK